MGYRAGFTRPIPHISSIIPVISGESPKNELLIEATRFVSGLRQSVDFPFFIAGGGLFGFAAQFWLLRTGVKILLEQGGGIGMVDVQGEPATKFYILVSGRLGVVLELDFGVTKKNYMVTSVGPGQMFAYSGLVGNPHYTAGSRAMANSAYLEFDVAKLNAAFNEDPRLGHVMMRMVAQTIASRLRAMPTSAVARLSASPAGSNWPLARAIRTPACTSANSSGFELADSSFSRT